MKTLSQIEPRTPIGSLPYVIQSSGAYYLTANLTGAEGANGISIQASNVSLDLNGFTLAGVPGSQIGIHVASGQSNVQVRHGTISRWTTGIEARAAGHCRFESLRIAENASQGLGAGAGSLVDNCIAFSNGGIGISTEQNSTIKDSAAGSNSLHGFALGAGNRIQNGRTYQNLGTGLVAGNHCIISACLAFNNSASGILTGEDAQIDGTKASSNGSNGIMAGHNATITGCSATGNLDMGIVSGRNTQVLDCKAVANTKGISVAEGGTVRGCSALQNSGDGILVASECVVRGNTSTGNFLARDAAGIHAVGTDNIIKENDVVSNDMGILVQQAGNLIVNNTAANNSLNYRMVGAPQSIGPIQSGPLPDVTNPLSNVEF